MAFVIGLMTEISSEREYIRDGKITKMVVVELIDARYKPGAIKGDMDSIRIEVNQKYLITATLYIFMVFVCECHLQVHKCVSGGGKVLIPTFALGRAQELCLLLDDYWERMNLKVPIYLSVGYFWPSKQLKYKLMGKSIVPKFS
ncbi:cleavage and polyadenylation specificity factor 73-I [Trifolium repens]|nr:cleavage and polyadenylation specificity factor 73-I [Trifolium repens]